jgi:hypothetical protein
MATDPDKSYYKNFSRTEDPLTIRELSELPSRKIDIFYKNADRIGAVDMDVKIVWADEVAIYLERGPEDDFMVPWTDVVDIAPRPMEP